MSYSRALRMRRQSGLTLMEVLVTLVVVIIGLLGIMKVASVAVYQLRALVEPERTDLRRHALQVSPARRQPDIRLCGTFSRFDPDSGAGTSV